MIMKKFCLFILTLCLCSQNMTAETITGSCGDNGDNLTWSFDTESGVPTISGNGAMRDYSVATPWYFNRSKIKTVEIKEGVTHIGECAFFNCESLTSVTIPPSVTSIGSSAFQFCYGLTGFTVSEENAEYSAIDGVLFNKEGDILISYPNAKAATYVIPDGVTSIGNAAFSYCSGLTSVTSIEHAAFFGCISLTEIYSLNPKPPLAGKAFDDFLVKNCKLYVPEDAKDDYRCAEGWSAF